MQKTYRSIITILSLSGIASTLTRSELAFSDEDTQDCSQNDLSENQNTVIEYNEEMQDELLLNELKKKADSTFGQEDPSVSTYGFTIEG